MIRFILALMLCSFMVPTAQAGLYYGIDFNRAPRAYGSYANPLVYQHGRHSIVVSPHGIDVRPIPPYGSYRGHYSPAPRYNPYRAPYNPYNYSRPHHHCR